MYLPNAVQTRSDPQLYLADEIATFTLDEGLAPERNEMRNEQHGRTFK